MPTDYERRAAKAAVEEQVRAILPDMFESYVTEDHLWVITDAALWAAEAARSKSMADKSNDKKGQT